jgi:hypothetical protein
MGLSRKDCERLGLDFDILYAQGKPIVVPSELAGPQSKVASERAETVIASEPYPGYPGRWVIEIPGWRPTFDNELKAVPMAAHRLKKRDVSILGHVAMALGVPSAIGRRRVRLMIRNRFGAFPDDTAPLKSLWDALKRNGLLIDDSREWLEFVWPPTYERGPKMTVIELEDI